MLRVEEFLRTLVYVEELLQRALFAVGFYNKTSFSNFALKMEPCDLNF